MTTIALIGASGTIGGRILDEALRRGLAVIGVGRNPDKLAPRDGLTVIGGDVGDPVALAPALMGADVLVVSLRWMIDPHAVLDTARRAGIGRLIAVVGAGSLDAGDGMRLLDTPAFPAVWRPGSEAAARALDVLRGETAIDWVAVSPSFMIEAGERTGVFRIGGDHLLRDQAGESRISREDFAVAIVDEIETPAHHRERITVGY